MYVRRIARLLAHFDAVSVALAICCVHGLLDPAEIPKRRLARGDVPG
jgi:hypothetical protein